jgi:flagellar protein FlbB
VAEYGFIGTGPRVLLLFLLLIVLVAGGVIWFDYLGVIDAKETIAPVLRILGKEPRTEVGDLESPLLLDDRRYNKQMEALALQAEALDKREEEISKREKELEQMMKTLEEQKKAQEEKEKSFNVETKLYENKRANLEQIARYLVGMPPEGAVAILEAMDDQDVVDLLRTAERLAQEAGESSIVSYWLFLMEANKAAAIQRKMAQKPRE